MFIQKDFDIEPILAKPLMAHLSTIENDEPRDSPVWFLYDESSLWIFGTSKDSFIKRLNKNCNCAIGIVDFDVEKGLLKHIGFRGKAICNKIDPDRLNHFLIKYLGSDSTQWNSWFIKHVVNPLNVMVQYIPKTIVAKDVSFFKTGPNLYSE